MCCRGTESTHPVPSSLKLAPLYPMSKQGLVGRLKLTSAPSIRIPPRSKRYPYFEVNFFKQFFQEHYDSVKQFGSRTGPTLDRSSSRSKLFAKVISRRQSNP